MSFKREGDDPSQLNLLKKRRVAELLSSDIPDDEALLMRNGRYACTVCGHRPVFDTVDMLAIHRQGKKHKNCLDIHYARKRRFAYEVQKRRQEYAVRKQETGETNQIEAPLLLKTQMSVRNVLLKAAPYDSRSKSAHNKASESSTRNSHNEKKGLFFQTMRRQRLQGTPAESTQSNTYNITEATPACSLPGNTHSSSAMSKNTSDFITKDQTKTSTFGKKLQFGKDDDPRPIKLQPYVPKAKRTSAMSLRNSESDKLITKGPVLPSAPMHKYYTPALWEQSDSDVTSHHDSNAESKLSYSQSHDTLQSNVSNSDHKTYAGNHIQQTDKKEEQLSDEVEEYSRQVNSVIMKELLQKDAKKNAALEQVQQALIGNRTEKPVYDKPTLNHSYVSKDDPLVAEKRWKELQHHLHLTSSGWKRDNSGNWIKDEDVEFDSDEDEPPE